MIFGEGVVGLLTLGLVLFCLLDVITSNRAEIRHLPKLVWVLLVIVPVGSVAWLVAGRPQGSTAGRPAKAGRVKPGHPPARPQRPSRRRNMAPDDDAAFLAALKDTGRTDTAAEHERMLGSWEDDLRRREEELRRQARGDDEPPD